MTSKPEPDEIMEISGEPPDPPRRGGGAIIGLAIGWAIVAISIITIMLICVTR